MSYTELQVVVDGSVDHWDSYTSKGALDAKVQEYVTSPHPYGLTEIYLMHHDHPMQDEECACIQYKQSSKPDIVIDNRQVDTEAP